MNPGEIVILHIVHVVAVLLLTGFTFLAFAAPPESRKPILMISGITTLVVLASGIRMWQGQFGFSYHGWIIVKLVCWLALSALGGLAYRRRNLAPLLMVVATVLLALAVAMVYAKPF
jgi:hypothetical protein